MKQAASAKPKHRHLHGLLLLAVGGVFFLLLSTSISSEDDLIKEINNFGHIVLFGMLAIGLLLWMKATQRERIASTVMQYLLTFVTALGIATLIEFLQVFGARSADLGDGLRNALGVTVFLGCYALFDDRLTRVYRLRRWIKALCLIALLVVPALALAPVAQAVRFEYTKFSQLPALMDFDEDWEYGLVLRSGANIYPINAGTHAGWARAQFQSGVFASLLFKKFWRYWGSYSRLVIELHSEAAQPETLSLLVFDMDYVYEWEDGFRHDAVLQPGANKITIDLSDIQRGPHSRQLQLCCIQAIELFRAREPRRLSIRIKRIALE